MRQLVEKMTTRKNLGLTMKDNAALGLGSRQETLQTLRESFGSRTVSLNGHQWEYIDTIAAGPAVVLLPGQQGTCEIFFKPLLRLGHRFRMVAVNFPANPDAAALAEGVVELLDYLSLPHVHLVGSSLGSYVAQVLAARYPERIGRLFLGNAFIDAADVRQHPAYNPEVISATAPEELKTQRLEKLRNMADGELKDVLLALMDRESPEIIKARALSVACAPPAPVVRLGDERVLLLECDDDETITPAEKTSISLRYASARRVVFPHGKHYPYVLVADDYCELLANFVTIDPAAYSGAAGRKK